MPVPAPDHRELRGGLDTDVVSSLSAGSYVLVVRDRSKKHNFHLTGPGVNRKTTVAGRGTFTWNLTLSAGTFAFRSDPQAKRVKGSFKVTG